MINYAQRWRKGDPEADHWFYKINDVVELAACSQGHVIQKIDIRDAQIVWPVSLAQMPDALLALVTYQQANHGDKGILVAAYFSAEFSDLELS